MAKSMFLQREPRAPMRAKHKQHRGSLHFIAIARVKITF
jgi:hypothetical protein